MKYTNTKKLLLSAGLISCIALSSFAKPNNNNSAKNNTKPAVVKPENNNNNGNINKNVGKHDNRNKGTSIQITVNPQPASTKPDPVKPAVRPTNNGSHLRNMPEHCKTHNNADCNKIKRNHRVRNSKDQKKHDISIVKPLNTETNPSVISIKKPVVVKPVNNPDKIIIKIDVNHGITGSISNAF